MHTHVASHNSWGEHQRQQRITTAWQQHGIPLQDHHHHHHWVIPASCGWCHQPKPAWWRTEASPAAARAQASPHASCRPAGSVFASATNVKSAGTTSETCARWGGFFSFLFFCCKILGISLMEIVPLSVDETALNERSDEVWWWLCIVYVLSLVLPTVGFVYPCDSHDSNNDN